METLMIPKGVWESLKPLVREYANVHFEIGMFSGNLDYGPEGISDVLDQYKRAKEEFTGSPKVLERFAEIADQDINELLEGVEGLENIERL